MVTPDPSGRATSVARELAGCRQRGIEQLDFSSRTQRRVEAPELEQLAITYVAAHQVQWRGRTSQIKGLLRAALEVFEYGNPADAQLITDVFFGTDVETVRRSPKVLLDAAKQRYGKPSDTWFRERRTSAFRNFAEFLIEFVGPESDPANSGTVLAPRPESSSAALPHDADRRWVRSPLEAILQFSLVDPGDTSALTIDEHQRIIDQYGRCWWGWFKAMHDADHTGAIAERLHNCDVGLWERSENLFYVAQCDRAVVGDGRRIATPDADLTPAYYRSQSYPAWLSFRSIRSTDQQEFAERFGDLPTTRSTISWSSEPTPEPVAVQAQGNSILHLSDLRFGSDHRWATAVAPRRSFITTEHAITQALLVHGVDLAAVGVVVICGNFVSDQPTAAAFREALACIDALCEQLPSVQREHFVIVPGADDFARPGDRERANQRLYREFHQGLYGGEEQDLTRMRRYEFATFRLNVLPVNSVKMLGLNERDEGMFGYGYDRQLHAMRDDYLRHHGRTRVINAVAAHHHLISTPVKWPETLPQEPVRARVMPGIHDARDVLTKLSASRVMLFLHGHLHEADCYTVTSGDGWQTVVCSAGTAGTSETYLRSHYRDNHASSLALYDVVDDQIRGRMLVFDEQFRRDPPVRRFEIWDQ